MTTLKANTIEPLSGNIVTIKSRIQVDNGSASFELTPARINAINAEASAGAALTSQYAAYYSELSARAAAEVTGNIRYFATYAEATDPGVLYSNGDIVEIFTDSTHSGNRTRYRVESGSLVYKITIDTPRPYRPVVTTFNANASLTDFHNVVLANANLTPFTINLADASLGTFRYEIQKIDTTSNVVTIDGFGSQTISGSLSITLNSQYDSVTLQSDGVSKYYIL